MLSSFHFGIAVPTVAMIGVAMWHDGAVFICGIHVCHRLVAGGSPLQTTTIMKQTFLALLFVVTSAGAQAPLPPEIENTQCLGINKQAWHATLMPYATTQEALAANRHASSFCRSLNGPWKFNWVPRPESRPVDFYKPSFDVSAWKDIPVPSNWQVHGYGTPFYRNNGYTFQKDFPHVMSEPPRDWTAYQERDPVGSYRRDFDLPKDWDGRRIFITFDGVDSAFYLWINGEKVGYSVNSRNAAEFDITNYVKPGRNMIAAEVWCYSSGSFLEDQDMWRLSGIFRNVTLWSTPQVHIRDFFIKTDLDPQYQDATLEVVAKVRNYQEKTTSGPQRVTAMLADKDGIVSRSLGANAAVPALKPGEETTVTVRIQVPNPDKWTAETPNLYTVLLVLADMPAAKATDLSKSGELLSSRVGFRKIELKDRLFLVNGTPIKLKGANRHEHWPEVGHAITEAQMIRDLEVLKQGNCNHVRTCHYSDDPRWYELCDQYGIWLVAEANCECHGYDHRFDDEPLMKAAIVDRNVSNVENHKNHPSVIIWSLGNECGGRGGNFLAAEQAIKAIDPARPVHYERFGIGSGNPADIDSQMYTHPNSVAQIATDPKLTKPFYLCEYAHAMFNSMGAIGEYNDLFDKYPSLLGGAIWEWQDQGLWNRRDPKHAILAYGGGFGDVPNDHYFIHKGVVAADRSPKPHYFEMKRAYQWIGAEPADLTAGTVKLRNKYQFISLAGFAGAWSLTEDGVEIEHGALTLPTLAPGAETTVTIPWKKNRQTPGADCYLNLSFTLTHDELWAKMGQELATMQFKLPAAQPAPAADLAKMKPVTLTQDAQTVTVAGNGFSVVLDKKTGTLSRLASGTINLLAPDGGPKLHLWRAPHRNDDMWAYGGWESKGLTALDFKTLAVTATQAGPNAVRVIATVRATGKGGFAATHTATYTICGDASVAVDNAVTFEGPRLALARLGVRMSVDKKLDRFDYLGRGPLENYADRKRGYDIGIYGSSVKEQQTPYAKPMECGNHEDVKWAALTGTGMPGILAQADGAPLQTSAIPFTDEQMTPVEYTIDLPPSTATVWCLCARTLGAGSAGCGPKPLDHYIVWSDNAQFSYILHLLPAGAKPTPELGRAAVTPRVKPATASRNRDGHVTLTCATTGAKIRYSIDGAAAVDYSTPFELKKPANLVVQAEAPGMMPASISIPMPRYQDHRQWRIVSCSSYQEGEGEPIHAIDGNPSTFWHTRWKPDEPKHPHELVIDFGATLRIKAVIYTGREEMENGRVKDYELFGSDDGKSWKPMAKPGRLANSADEQLITLSAVASARYMKFVAKSEAHGKAFASVAELDVIPAE